MFSFFAIIYLSVFLSFSSLLSLCLSLSLPPLSMTYSSLTVDTASSFSIQTCAGIFSHQSFPFQSLPLSLFLTCFFHYMSALLCPVRKKRLNWGPRLPYSNVRWQLMCVCVRECVTGGLVCACVCDWFLALCCWKRKNAAARQQKSHACFGGQRYKSDPLITVSHAIRHLQLVDYIYPLIILMFVSPVIRYSKLTTNKEIFSCGSRAFIYILYN